MQRDYFIKTKNFLPEMSSEESLGAIPITLLLIPFVFVPLFKLLETLPEAWASVIFPVPVTPVFDERQIGIR